MWSDLERALSEYSLQDIFDKKPAVLSLLGCETPDLAVQRTLLLGALTNWLFRREEIISGDESLKDVAILLMELPDNAKFIKEYFDEFGVSPIECAANEGLKYGFKYFTFDNLISVYPELVKQAESLHKKHEEALRMYERACASNSVKECERALHALSDLKHEFDMQWEIAHLEGYIEKVKKQNVVAREASVEKLLAWREREAFELDSYANHIVSQAEIARSGETLIDHWCVAITDHLQKHCVFGGEKRHRFSECAKMMREKRYAQNEGGLPYAVQIPYELENEETQRLEDAVEEDLARRARYAKLVEAFLNAIDNLDDLDSMRSEFDEFRDIEPAERFASLCQCLAGTQMADWRNRLLNATSRYEYEEVSSEMAACSKDRLIAAKVEEIRLCGGLIDSGRVAFCAKVLSPQHSVVFDNNERGQRFDCSKEAPHFPVQVKAKLDYQIEDYMCETRVIQEGIQTQGYGWIGSDGKEYVTIYKVQNQIEKSSYDHEFRSYDHVMSRERIQEVTSAWIPAKWAVEEVGRQMGTVRLRPLEPLDGQIVLEFLCDIENPAKQRLAISKWHTLSVEHEFDPAANISRAYRKSSTECQSLIEVPWEYVINHEGLFACDQPGLADEVGRNRLEAANRIKARRRREEQEREEHKRQVCAKRREENYKEALNAIRGFRTITREDVRRIHDSTRHAMELFKGLGDYENACKYVELIASKWQVDAEIGKEIEIGRKRWMIYNKEWSGQGWIAWLISLESIAEFAFPESCERGRNAVHRWLNLTYFLSLHNFEQLRLGYWDRRDESEKRSYGARNDIDRQGIAVEHFQLPTLRDYEQMPNSVKAAIQEASHDSEWWLFTETEGILGRKAYYVGSSVSGKAVSTTRNLAEQRGVHPICVFHI